MVLYLEESGFYEDVEYAKRLGYIEAYVKQINLLNKGTSIRVLIMNRDSRFLIRIFAESYATRNLDIVSLLGRHSSIRNEKIPLLESFVEAYIMWVNNIFIFNSLLSSNQKLITYGYNLNSNTDFNEYFYVCIDGSRTYKKEASIKFDFMDSEFTKQAYDYCVKNLLNIPDELKRIYG